MKLTKEQVEKISRLALDALKRKELLTLKADEKKVLDRIAEVILADLRAEEALDREVENILKSHTGSIDTARLDYRKMFSMIKTRLAKERGIVL